MGEHKQDLPAFEVEAVSGVNVRGEGFVHISMEVGNGRKAVLQANTAEAREISRHIAEAAEAAETDAFLVQFFTRKLNLSIEQAGAFLMDFRAWRDVSGGVKNRGKDDPHWQEMMRRKEEGKAQGEPLG
jgi:hypothetical protein